MCQYAAKIENFMMEQLGKHLQRLRCDQPLYNAFCGRMT